MCNIAANKNTIPGDKSAMLPGGLRMGTPAMTTRGFKEAEFEIVCQFLDRAIGLTRKVSATTPSKKFKDFTQIIGETGGDLIESDLQLLKRQVIELADSFPIPHS
jgi:glycine hydroxymethyltransferase